jgi:nucleotide-binding universal stress UspA family protein
MTTERIIVGVDGSVGARAALDWAVDECRLRACTLLVVHARGRHPDAGGSVLPGYDAVAEHLLAEHVAAASARRPSVPVTTLLTGEPPADTLIELSHEAELVVVGTRGNNGFTSTMLGSVSNRAAVHAHCPVAVVPQRSVRPSDQVQRPVVVGVSDGQASRLALEFARHEAEVRGAPLEIVHADDEPAESLLRAAEQAQLLVVGVHHSDERWSTRLGPVPASVLHRSPCPVVVVGELPDDQSKGLRPCRQDRSIDSLVV